MEMEEEEVAIILTMLGCASVLALLRESQKAHKRVKRSCWVRAWIDKRNSNKPGTGTILHLARQELRLQDKSAFFNFLRMSERHFNEILELITPDIQRQDTNMREAIHPWDRLAVTLRFLATGDTFRDLSYGTRIAANTISVIVTDTLKAINNRMSSQCVQVPKSQEEWAAVAAEFEKQWQFPHCLGALDGKHVTFRPRRCDGSFYRNYKGSDSIILLALVDANYKFIYLDIGKNGRSNDGRVFRETPLSESLLNGTLPIPKPNNLAQGNTRVPYVIIADDAFPLSSNLLKPYSHCILSHEMKVFNYRLSRARRVVENAFGILCQKFAVLLNPITLAVDKVDLIVTVCCTLHNYLIEKKLQSKSRIEDKDMPRDLMEQVEFDDGDYVHELGENVRNTFKEYFLDVGRVSWQDNMVLAGRL